MNDILLVEDLRVYYELPQGVVKAVDGVSFNVREGEIFGIAGESGSGKSTLALAITGLLRPPAKLVSGRILFKGVDLTKFSEREWRSIRGKRISMIFQDPTTYLNPVYTAGFQVAEVFEAHRGGVISSFLKDVVEIFRRVKIADPERRVASYPHQLSGGMKQRVLISMAIAEKPDLIIADEPTSALDVTIQAEIVDLLNELRRSLRSSIIFITHDLALLTEIADRIMVMYAGKVVEIADRESIVSEPKHPYTRGLMESIKYDRKARLKAIKGSVPSLIDPPKGCRFHPRCPLAMDECRVYEPKRVVDAKGGVVYCHLYKGE
jgi:peptide/nickel transport system ATP-binding protein